MNRSDNFNRPWYQWIRLLIPEELSGKHYLDLGGGAGEISRYVAQRGAKVTFVDIDQANVDHAHSLGFTANKLDLNTSLDKLGKSVYDGVLLLDVIEHIWKAEKLLSNINHLLCPGGYLFLTTPNIAHINKRLKTLLKGTPPFDEGYHIRFFTIHSIYQRLEDTHFKIDSINHATSTFGSNHLKKFIGKGPGNLNLPVCLQNLLVRHIALRAIKMI
ncbi:methyltransferase domain-containing protein [candidate division KSB1 bacterium]|nr:methyltransferase domain-containing protein [candidate division KSB1 bacterium]